MKRQIRNITMLVLGLLLTGLPSVANPWNTDTSTSGPYVLGGGGVTVPSNATVHWYAYAYNGGWARVMAYMSSGMFLDESQNSNGSSSGSAGVPQAGPLSIYLEVAGGPAGCGVTVAW